jgi:catechol 2,3-dioxygenase-like lactoylglutathione lyase family enzyme
MTAAITGIDHVVIAVNDLDRAETAYRRLGFILSPRALHSGEMGTANHTIMLEHDYFELLAVLTPTDNNGRWREALADGEGVVGLAVGTPAAAAVRAAWLQAELSPGGVIGFSRSVERPGGIKTQARFEIVSLPKDTLPGVSLFACAQLTRGAVWLPELLVHPNTAVAIRKITVSVPDPLAASRAWVRGLPGAVAAVIEGGMRIRLAKHIIDLLDARTAARRYRLAKLLDGAKAVALDFAVGIVEDCRAAIAEGGAKMEVHGDSTVIGANQSCGVAITMVPASSPIM